MKRLLFIGILINSLSAIGQEYKKLVINVKESIDRKATFFVEPLIADPVLAIELFKNSLSNNGFKVITQKKQATYVITINYKDRADTGCGGRVIKQLTGQINESTKLGEIMVTFSFKQSSFEGKCTSDIMNALAQKLK